MDTSESSNPSNTPLEDELAPPADPSAFSVDDLDIPTAKREAVLPTAQRSVNWPLMVGGVGAIAIVGLAIFGFQAITASNGTVDSTADTAADGATSDSSNPDAVGESDNSATENLGAGSDATTGTAASGTPSATEETILGHKAYEEAPQSELVPVRTSGGILLRETAADKLDQMIADAYADGVNLVVISGFRTFEDQRYLFFDVKAERGQTSQDRAEVSAPPGYSEHHTGYAVDFADGYYPDTDLQIDFEETPAFQWLQDNAAYYGFELSFPRNNEQGISYEPWHWRFVGDPDSLETFYKGEPAPSANSANNSSKSPSPNSSDSAPERESSSSSDDDSKTAPERESSSSESDDDQARDADPTHRATNQALIHFGDRNQQSDP